MVQRVYSEDSESLFIGIRSLTLAPPSFVPELSPLGVLLCVYSMASIMASFSIFFFVPRSPVSSISSAAECSRAFLLSCFRSVVLLALPSSFPHPPASFAL